MIACDIDIDDWERQAGDRMLWCEKVTHGTRTREGQRVEATPAKHGLRKIRRSDNGEVRFSAAIAGGVAGPPLDLSATKDVVFGPGVCTHGIFSLA